MSASDGVDWDIILEHCTEGDDDADFKVYTGFCENDNYVSFWELIWNFENVSTDIEITGNIHEED